MLSAIVSRVVILVFGTLYPAYASYKSVRSKNIREYVKWMMYWIVFALFTTAETFTDVFLGFWFPFYYEVKVILVFWLLSPMTNGSSFLYRKFVHPMLSKREQDIDEYIARAKDQGYSTVLSLGTKGVNYATAVIMQTAIKGGGGLVNQLRRSYSLSDINMGMDEMNRVQARANADQDRTDAAENRTSRQRAYSSRQGVEMYFPEVDVDVRQRGPREPSVPLSQIRSTEDVSSGYSSAEPLYARAPTEDPRESLVRTSSVGSARVTRTRTTRAAASPGAKTRATPTEDSISFDECEESDPDDLDEEFFEVTTSMSPSIIIKPITCTMTMHQATLTTPAEIRKPVTVEESLSVSPMLKTFSDSLLEMYLDNIGDNGDDTGIESVKKDNLKINEKKYDDVVPKVGGNTQNVIEIKMPEKREDVPSNVPAAKTVEKTDDALVKIVAQDLKPKEQKVIEIEASDNESKTEERCKVIEIKAIDDESKTNELCKVIEIKAIDNESKTEELCKVPIPTTEANIEESKPALVDTEPDNFEDADFFDTASISPSVESLAESEQKVTNAKLDRAGKYHKRPAPVPPRKADSDSLSPDGDDVSFKSADSRGSSSPRREVPISDLPTISLEVQRKIDADERDISKLVTPTGASPKASAHTLNATSGAKPKAESPPSPNQQKKSKESPMSRLLSKFFSHEGASRGLVATSLTDLTNEIEAELRSASSLTFLGPDKAPKLPPKPPRKDAKNEVKDGSSSGFRIREMSHSPPRRKSDI